MKWDELPDDLQWDRKLAYFLDPANQNDISKSDLQDVLAILTAKYCDEFYNLRFLECFVDEQLGSDRLEEAIEAGIEADSVDDRSEYVRRFDSVEARMAAALGFVNKITEEFDDMSGDLSDEDF